MMGYIQAKARRYMGMGAIRYARADHFHLPPADLSPSDLLALTTGMGQLATDSGGTVNDPLVSLSAEQVHLLFNTLHFRIVGCRTVRGRRGDVDEYIAEHVVTGRPLILFATAPRIDMGSSEELSARKVN